jgi:two-component system, cell cycle sensor histidine kinase and response regulator CckA
MRTILVADNEGPIVKIISQALRDAGYRILSASSGDSAVSLARKEREPIDLLITDIVMPGMGGADLYASLKSEQPDLRVLFISGFMNRGPLPGGFLKKPFTPAMLVEAVRELLETSSTAGGA